MSRSALTLIAAAALVIGAASTAFAQANPSAAENAQWTNRPCKDPWVSKAVQDVKGSPASGSASSGECDPHRYHNSSWGSFHELTGYVVDALIAKPAGAVLEFQGNVPQLRVVDAAKFMSIIGSNSAGIIGSNSAGVSSGTVFSLIGSDSAGFGFFDRHTLAVGEAILRAPSGKMLVLRKK